MQKHDWIISVSPYTLTNHGNCWSTVCWQSCCVALKSQPNLQSISKYTEKNACFSIMHNHSMSRRREYATERQIHMTLTRMDLTSTLFRQQGLFKVSTHWRGNSMNTLTNGLQCIVFIQGLLFTEWIVWFFYSVLCLLYYTENDNPVRLTVDIIHNVSTPV